MAKKKSTATDIEPAIEEVAAPATVAQLPPRRVVEIRTGSIEDVDDIIVTMRRAHEECPRILPPVDLPYVRGWCAEILKKHLSWVAVCNGEIVGCLLCAPHHKSWSPTAFYLENMHWYVSPKFRRHGVAQRLLERYRKAAEATGLMAQLTVTYGDMPDIKDRFARRQGYMTYLGGNHLYIPTTSPYYQHLPTEVKIDMGHMAEPTKILEAAE